MLAKAMDSLRMQYVLNQKLVHACNLAHSYFKRFISKRAFYKCRKSGHFEVYQKKNGTFYTIFRFVSYDFHIFKKFSGMNIIY